MRSMGTMVAVILGGLLLAGGPALGATSYWGSATGNFSDIGSWQSGGVPGASDDAHFENNATYTVNFTADAENEDAVFDAAGGAVSLDTTDSYGWTLSGGVTLADTMTLNLKRGELTTSGDSTLNYATIFELGNASAFPVETFTWNITGGTTKFISAGASSDSTNYLGIGKTDQRGQGILNISGAGTVVSNNNWVHIGLKNWNSPGCQINISGGAKMYTAGNSYIGWSSANNKVVVDGAGSQWTVTGVATGQGSGNYNTLIVTNGGSIVGGVTSGAEGDNNEVIITGAGSSVIGPGINVGPWYGADNNTLTVADGASCYVSSGDCALGKDQNGASPATQSNTVHVTGAGSTLTATNSNFYISGSNSSFRVTDGGFANLLQWGGIGTLGVGGTWSVIEVSDPDSELSIGKCDLGASGSINVTNGGAFVSRGGSVHLGQGSGAEASVLVSGSGSTFSSTGAPFRVASQSDGRITVADGGVFEHTELDSNFGASIGYAAGETGTVVVTGADSVFRYTDVDDGNGTFRVGESGVGILTIADGGLVEDGNAVIGDGSGSSGTATIVGGGSVWTNTGSLTVGRSANDSTATLAFELDANGAGTVYVDGTMTIYPTQSYLTVDLSNYQWEQGMEFVLVDCGTLGTTFSNVSVTGLNGGTITQDEGNNNQIILTVNGPQGTVISIR